LDIIAAISSIKEKSIRCIIHLASPTPSSAPELQGEIEDVVINLGKLAIELAEKSGAHLIFASTIRIHPLNVSCFSKSAVIAPFDGYGRGKLAVEDLCRERFGRGGGNGCTILRISSVQGVDNSGRARGLVGLFARQMLTEKLTIMGDGSSTKDLVHVDDLVVAIRKAADSTDGRVREVYVGSGIGYTVKEIANAVVIAAATRGKSVEISHISRDQNDLSGFIQDNSAAEYLGWRVKIGLEMMVSEALDSVLPREEG
jgi:nucleoside-diphosphate-sugar epimerase